MDSNLSGDVAAGTAAVVVQGLWRHRRGEAGLAGWWAGRAASLRSHKHFLVARGRMPHTDIAAELAAKLAAVPKATRKLT